MKKIRKLISLGLTASLLFFSSCEETKPDESTSSSSQSSTSSSTTASSTTTSKPQVKQDLRAYFPLKANEYRYYEGEGSEFAGFSFYFDYIDQEQGLAQVRRNNTGTELVEVLSVQEDELAIIYSNPNCFYRDNFIELVSDYPERDILLKAPLELGTKWEVPNQGTREITAVDQKITVKHKNKEYTALEVTGTFPKYEEKLYFVEELGLVATTQTTAENYTTRSSLSELEIESVWEMPLTVFYPTENYDLVAEERMLFFTTNDISRFLIQEELAGEPQDSNLAPLIKANVKINHLYRDGTIAYLDFSKDFLIEMNLGAAYEASLINAIINTIGHYYEADEVYFTIEGEPYFSGHIQLEEGETFPVDYSLLD